MAIVNMPGRTLIEITKFAIIVEEELPMRWKNMAKYRQNDFDSDEFDDYDDENEHHEKKTKQKSKKVDFDIVRRGEYYQSCF
jgi:hypothetical protein